MIVPHRYLDILSTPVLNDHSLDEVSGKESARFAVDWSYEGGTPLRLLTPLEHSVSPRPGSLELSSDESII